MEEESKEERQFIRSSEMPWERKKSDNGMGKSNMTGLELYIECTSKSMTRWRAYFFFPVLNTLLNPPCQLLQDSDLVSWRRRMPNCMLLE